MKRIRGKDKISLEEYLDFIDSHRKLDLTVNYLNQIIDMHGFKKLHKLPKKVLIDAVSTIDLIDPYRSTLSTDNSISSCAFITLDEVIKDLADLNWQECSVVSVQTLSSANQNYTAHDDFGLQNADSSKSEVRGKAWKSGAVGGGVGTSSSCSSAVDGYAGKLVVPKRKRNVMQENSS